MKVSIYLTWFSQNFKKFHVDHCPNYGTPVTGPLQAKTQIIYLQHEGSTTWVQCQLGFVGSPVATKRYLLRSFVINGFLVNQEHVTCPSWATARLVYGLEGQN